MEDNFQLTTYDSARPKVRPWLVVLNLQVILLSSKTNVMPHLLYQVCDLILYDVFLGIGFLRLYLYVQSLSSSSMPLKITFGYGSWSFPLIIVRHAFEVIINKRELFAFLVSLIKLWPESNCQGGSVWYQFKEHDMYKWQNL